jgi:hypothetical protein
MKGILECEECLVMSMIFGLLLEVVAVHVLHVEVLLAAGRHRRPDSHSDRHQQPHYMPIPEVVTKRQFSNTKNFKHILCKDFCVSNVDK